MMVYSYTPLIRLSDLSYPKYFADVKKEFPNTSFPAQMEESEFSIFGYAAIHEVTAPTGDVVERGVPVLEDDGFYYWTWTTRDFTPEEIAANLVSAKNSSIFLAQERVDAQFLQTSTSITYGSTVYGVYLRPEDITTLLALKSLAEQGSIDEPFTLRLYDGSLSGTATEVIGLINSILSVYCAIQQRAWSYMASVDSATSIAGIPPVPEDFLS